jgi:hypothetical protein
MALFTLQDTKKVQRYINNGIIDISQKNEKGENLLMQLLNNKIDYTNIDINRITIKHNGFEYKMVVSPHTGEIWLDRNLGASRVARSYDDELAYGDYFQWGRSADGHEKVNSSITSTISSSSRPNHSKFITSDGDNRYDWLKNQDDSLWKDGKNCPCPPGFRLPTSKELAAETIEVGIKNSKDALNSFLKFPSAGYRDYISGSLDYQGSNAAVWSSSVVYRLASYLYFGSDYADVDDYFLACGRSVRCLKA